jgi:hypothetical protein
MCAFMCIYGSHDDAIASPVLAYCGTCSLSFDLRGKRHRNQGFYLPRFVPYHRNQQDIYSQIEISNITTILTNGITRSYHSVQRACNVVKMPSISSDLGVQAGSINHIDHSDVAPTHQTPHYPIYCRAEPHMHTQDI